VASATSTTTAKVPGAPRPPRQPVGQLRRRTASHAFVSGNRYLEPRLVLAATHVSAAAVKETGGGLGCLAVDAVDKTDVSLSPQVAVGGEIARSSGTLLHPRFVIGLTQYLTDPATDVTASLASAPPQDGGFGYNGDADRTRFDFEAALDLFGRNGLQISAQVAGQLSPIRPPPPLRSGRVGPSDHTEMVARAALEANRAAIWS
jgi:hypothetical protein